MDKLRLNFKVPLLDIEGQPLKYVDPQGNEIPPSPLNLILGRTLMRAIEKDPTKAGHYFDWGKDLGQSGILELSTTELEVLVKYVEITESLDVMQKGYINQVIREAKDKAEADKKESKKDK